MDQTYTFTSRQRTDVTVANGAEAALPQLVARLDPHGVVVVHDPAVAEAAQRIGAVLGATAVLAVEGGDAAKRLDVVGRLAERLHEAGATRATVLVAIGGGTVTDLAGFVASIYLRGVPFVSCPTTTLAMCDAALGGKNGVDHCGLKNRLGTIRQPDAIVMDVAWLRSLPDEMFGEGIVEVVKKAAVLDAARFAELEALAPALRARDDEATVATIAVAVQMKMAVVLADERESDRRRALNAGHTIGHALESLAAGRLRHGHAVAMGLLAECRAAGVDAAITTRIEALLREVGA
ncbi:MAG: 3-dehydroquinate synthase, partial [Planctomycetes bacterium]|nr:3-dehydroquinate synthase [Planctomycetota bacterium]